MTSSERSERLTSPLTCSLFTFGSALKLSMLALTFLKLTDETYLAMVSVQVPQLADIAQGDPLRQSLRAHVRRGKGRQAVRRICKRKRLKPTC